MKRVLLALALFGLAMGSANAQVTDLAGGVFIAHYVPEIVNSEPPEGWCGQYYANYAIADHSEQNIRVDTATYAWSAWYVLSGFCEDKQFCGCQFGVGQYSDVWGFDTGSTQPCWPPVAAPSGLELPSGAWPGPGEGTALTSTSGPWDGNYMAVYLMTGYAYGYGYTGVVQLDVNGQTGAGGWTNCEGVPIEFEPAAYGGLGVNMDGVYAEPVCSTPPGACCFADGHCEMLLEVECPEVWMGGPCDPNPCSPPEVACCFPDGTCLLLTVESCIGQDGVPEAFPSTCDPNPCPVPDGACCYLDGTCIVAPEADCPTGDWRMFEVCDPNPCPQPDGACCFPDGHCEMIQETACSELWVGGPCDPNPCEAPLGACCYPDGTCIVAPEVDCPTGDWRIGEACDPNPCPQPLGACCLEDGQCILIEQVGCEATSGATWYGGPCDPNPCPQLFEGACCLPDGTCYVAPEDQCIDGTYMGDLTVCDPNPCVQPDGACCFGDGSCIVMVEVACSDAGGLWLGSGTNCDPNLCPQPHGACCLEDGSCLVTYEVACIGVWLGPETSCDPNPCPQPTVCCDGADCVIVYSEIECVNMGGNWYPDLSSCDPNPCEPVPTDGASWGSIKALYR
ncbi:hypothetical protein ACFL6M_05425 [Candidatus Eisenbacteria bacterium]|uniref:Uncharacterized protein n=1 Tax=Eiseniibacteriota bacterium TaxID=2212470 RepID=A0ABV6YL10_UNCEI